MTTDEAIQSSGWRVLDFSPIGDSRGWLISLQGERGIPFGIRRVYYIFGTQTGVRRGMHAHHQLEQVAVCVSGSCSFLIDDGSTRRVVSLDSPAKGLYLGGVIWHEMFDFSPDCVLMVLASDYYDESDYIRDYDEFQRVIRGNAG